MSGDLETWLKHIIQIRSTKPFIPWRIGHTEKYNNRQEARVRENI